jgi:RNA methyltransferase, TrmH family
VFVAAEGRDNPAVSALISRAEAAGTRVFELAAGVMDRVADTVTPQPVCAIVAGVDLPIAAVLSPSPSGGTSRLVLVCVDVRDPGNLGAVLRIAAASGVAAVVVCAGSVDPYNPKTVRASAGAVFQVPLVKSADPSSTLVEVRRAGYALLGTAAAGGVDYLEVDLDKDVAFVLGNEASGLPPLLETGLDGVVTIPMAPGTESLNVAMTAAVLCFEAARRVRSRGAPPSMRR